MKIGSLIPGFMLVATSVALALIFYSSPVVVARSFPGQGDWTSGYWVLTVVLGLGGTLIIGIAVGYKD